MRQHPLASLSASNRSKKPTEVFYYNLLRRQRENCMPKTRRKGSIIKRGENTWQIKLFVCIDSEGKRKNHTATIRGTKKEAEQYLHKILHERDLGTFVDTPSISISNYFEMV